MEGWYVIGATPNRPQRNNNPGDINFGSFAEKFGATLETGTPHPRFACFPTAEQGWACLNALLSGPAYSGLTIQEAVNKYAPPVENDVNQYVALVTKWTGLDPDVRVADALAAAS